MQPIQGQSFREWSVNVNAISLIVFERTLCDLGSAIPDEVVRRAHEMGRSPMSFVAKEVAEAMGVEGGLTGLC